MIFYYLSDLQIYDRRTTTAGVDLRPNLRSFVNSTPGLSSESTPVRLQQKWRKIRWKCCKLQHVHRPVTSPCYRCANFQSL